MSTFAKVLLVFLALGLFFIGVPTHRIYLYRSPESIERYLQTKTPLGSSEAEVAAYLKGLDLGRSLKPAVKHPILPGSEYPLSRLGGQASMHELVGEYRVLFWTSVEAFYIFNAKGELTEIRVRKTVDAL